MDLVLVGLPGSGKSVVGRRLAARHGAEFIDLDERIERDDGRTDPGHLRRGRRGRPSGRWSGAAVADLGPADPAPEVRRVIATGGGAVVDPRNRWRAVSRPARRSGSTAGRRSSPSVCVGRPHVRPLVAGRDPIGAIRDLRDAARTVLRGRRAARDRASPEVAPVVERPWTSWLAERAARPPAGDDPAPARDTPIGRVG